MPWRLKEAGHQQEWHRPNKPEYSVSSISKVNIIFMTGTTTYPKIYTNSILTKRVNSLLLYVNIMRSREKSLMFSRLEIQMHFLEWKYLYFHCIFLNENICILIEIILKLVLGVKLTIIQHWSMKWLGNGRDMIQCWPTCMSPYDATKPQWVSLHMIWKISTQIIQFSNFIFTQSAAHNANEWNKSICTIKPINSLRLSDTYTSISKLTIIGSDNGLLPGRCQAISWTNAGILLIGPLGTNFSENLIEIYIFSFKKMHFKMPSGTGQPFCLILNVSRVGGVGDKSTCCPGSRIAWALSLLVRNSSEAGWRHYVVSRSS